MGGDARREILNVTSRFYATSMVIIAWRHILVFTGNQRKNEKGRDFTPCPLKRTLWLAPGATISGRAILYCYPRFS